MVEVCARLERAMAWVRVLLERRVQVRHCDSVRDSQFSVPSTPLWGTETLRWRNDGTGHDAMGASSKYDADSLAGSQP